MVCLVEPTAAPAVKAARAATAAAGAAARAATSMETRISYTLRGKDGQTLIVRPIDPTNLEIICLKDDPNWPVFGADR